MKIFYQVVYKEDDEFGYSQRIYADIIDAWASVLQECENDRDIAYLLERVSQGEITIKSLTSKE